MKNKSVWIASILTALLLFGAVWGVMRYQSYEEVAEVKAMAAEMFANRENMTDEQRRAHHDQFREAEKQLSDSQRSLVRRDMRQQMQNRMEQRFQEFTAMSPQEKRKRLDNDINEMIQRQKEAEKRRKEWEASGKQGDPPRGGRGGPGGPGRGGAEKKGSAVASNGGQPRGRGGRGERRENDDRTSEERRDDRRRRMLDHTTPESRAQMLSLIHI